MVVEIGEVRLRGFVEKAGGGPAQRPGDFPDRPDRTKELTDVAFQRVEFRRLDVSGIALEPLFHGHDGFVELVDHEEIVIDDDIEERPEQVVRPETADAPATARPDPFEQRIEGVRRPLEEGKQGLVGKEEKGELLHVDVARLGIHRDELHEDEDRVLPLLDLGPTLRVEDILQDERGDVEPISDLRHLLDVVKPMHGVPEDAAPGYHRCIRDNVEVDFLDCLLVPGPHLERKIVGALLPEMDQGTGRLGKAALPVSATEAIQSEQLEGGFPNRGTFHGETIANLPARVSIGCLVGMAALPSGS